MKFSRKNKGEGAAAAAGAKKDPATPSKSRKGLLAKLLHPRIGARTAIGFASVLALTTIVSIVGLRSFEKYADQVTVSDEMSLLSTDLLQARAAEKNFQLRRDPAYIEEVMGKVQDVRGRAAKIEETLDSAEGQAMVEQVLAAADAYQQAFQTFAERENQKADALAEMLKISQGAKEAASEIGQAQKQASTKLQDRITRMAIQREDKMKAAEDANKLLTLTGALRRNEKDLLLSGDPEYADAVDAAADEITTGEWVFGDSEVFGKILLAVTNYQVAFGQLKDVLASTSSSDMEQIEILHAMDGEIGSITKMLPDLEKALTEGASEVVALRDVGQVAAALAKAQLAVKEFILKPGPVSAGVVTQSAEQVTKYCAELPGRFASPVIIEIAGQMAKAIKAYAEGFARLSDVRYGIEGFLLKKRIAADELVSTADEAEELIVSLREEAQREYDEAAKELKAMQFTSLLKLQMAEDAGSMVKLVTDAREGEKSFLMDGNERAVMTVTSSMALVGTMAEDMGGQLQDPKEKEVLAQLQAMAESYQNQFLKVVDLTAEQAAANQKMVEAADAVNAVTQTARDGRRAAMEGEKTIADQVNLWGTVTALLLGILLAYVIGRGVSRPVNQMTRAMQRLADGDLETEIPARDRRDEIGEMAATVQIFKDNALDKIRLEKEQEEKEQRAEEEKRAAMVRLADQFETSVGEVVEQVSSAAAQMKASSESMSATAEETTQQSAAVAAASEQASANVQTVASAAEELSSSISEIGRQVTQASTIASGAVKEAEKTNAKIQGLAEAASKIGEVVALITDIADQTNLLALNATIEAARAGDAGKGFAVVASEVKNLANQTAKATEEIGSQIAGIQNATQDAVTAIESITKTIAEIHDVNTGIASAVEQQGAATQEIARNVEQAAAGTHEVTSNISGVSRAANDTGAAAGQIQAAASDLSEQSEKLRSEVERFLGSVRTA